MQDGRMVAKCVSAPREEPSVMESADLSLRGGRMSMPAHSTRAYHSGYAPRAFASPTNTAAYSYSGTLGLTPGGAQDITNARQNIKNDYMPLPDSITYEGIFSEYYFDITGNQQCQEGQLFCPVFQTRVSVDPFTESGNGVPKQENYMAVGLKSSLTAADWERPRLNLGLVLDISGSMSAGMADYYYDFANNTWVRNDAEMITKMKVARESLVNLLQKLKPDDSVSIVVFDDKAELIQPLAKISDIDLTVLAKKILALEPRGGTDMSAGYGMMLKQFKNLTEASGENVENRIILLTDAQPNWGTINPEGLNRLIVDAYEKYKGTGTTFLLIGLDANTQLVELIGKVRGSNYFSIESVPQFKDRLRRTFDYMVTPLMFDLGMTMSSNGYRLKHVYGSPDVNATDENPQLIHVKSLFPSESSARGVKGGLVLLLLEKNENCVGENCDQIQLEVKYETRNGRVHTASRTFAYEGSLPTNEDDDLQDSIRKGILLTRYGRALKFWLQTERKVEHPTRPISPALIWRLGLPVDFPQSNRWELLSQKLTVSPAMKAVFRRLKDYFEEEMRAINDSDMQKDVDVILKLLKAPDTAPPDATPATNIAGEGTTGTPIVGYSTASVSPPLRNLNAGAPAGHAQPLPLGNVNNVNAAGGPLRPRNP